MIELGKDRSGGLNAKSVCSREVNAWARLSMHFGISDVFYADEYRRIGSKSYTWCRQRSTSSWARLDRFYTNNTLRKRRGRHGIWPTLFHVSDHACIFLEIPFCKRKLRMHSAFNRTLLQDDEAVQCFEGAWTDALGHHEEPSLGSRIVTALEQIRRVSVTISKEKK